MKNILNIREEQKDVNVEFQPLNSLKKKKAKKAIKPRLCYAATEDGSEHVRLYDTQYVDVSYVTRANKPGTRIARSARSILSNVARIILRNSEEQEFFDHNFLSSITECTSSKQNRNILDQLADIIEYKYYNYVIFQGKRRVFGYIIKFTADGKKRLDNPALFYDINPHSAISANSDHDREKLPTREKKISTAIYIDNNNINSNRSRSRKSDFIKEIEKEESTQLANSKTIDELKAIKLAKAKQIKNPTDFEKLESVRKSQTPQTLGKLKEAKQEIEQEAITQEIGCSSADSSFGLDSANLSISLDNSFNTANSVEAITFNLPNPVKAIAAGITNCVNSVKSTILKHRRIRKTLSEFYPINEEDALVLCQASGRKFSSRDINSLLLKLSKKKPNHGFFTKVLFMSYMTEVLKNELEYEEQQQVGCANHLSAISNLNESVSYGTNGISSSHSASLSIAQDTANDAINNTQARGAESLKAQASNASRSIDQSVPSIDHSTLWGKVRSGLRNHFGSQGNALDFSWFSKLIPEEDHASKKLTLKAPTNFITNYIQDNYGYLIERLCRQEQFKLVEICKV